MEMFWVCVCTRTRMLVWNVFWWAADWLARLNRGSITSQRLSSAHRVRGPCIWGEWDTVQHEYTQTHKNTCGRGAKGRVWLEFSASLFCWWVYSQSGYFPVWVTNLDLGLVDKTPHVVYFVWFSLHTYHPAHNLCSWSVWQIIYCEKRSSSDKQVITRYQS